MQNEKDKGAQGEWSALKTVQMPSAEATLLKLREAGIYGKHEQVDRFYDALVDQVADSPIHGGGLVMAWAMAGYQFIESVPGYAATMQRVMIGIDLSFDKVMQTIVPDAQVVEDARNQRESLKAALQANR